MADSPTERRARTPLPPRQDGKPPAGRPGGQPAVRTPRFPGGRSFWMIVLGLLVVNYVLMAVLSPGREPSVTIPYSNPSGKDGFIQQINAGNVDKVNSTGTTIQGEFKKEIRYPDDKAEPAKNFETELPTFNISTNG